MIVGVCILSANILESLWDAGMAVLDAMSLITDDNIRARSHQGLVKLYNKHNNVQSKTTY